ncbi:MAG: hypothetical protein HQM11_14345 [SAR324 cluster bacterium]|nr:hypothetical protein [SAR324 cluster bacterium]
MGIGIKFYEERMGQRTERPADRQSLCTLQGMVFQPESVESMTSMTRSA